MSGLAIVRKVVRGIFMMMFCYCTSVSDLTNTFSCRIKVRWKTVWRCWTLRTYTTWPYHSRTARCSLSICVWPAIAIIFDLIQGTLRRTNGSVYETCKGLQYGLMYIIYIHLKEVVSHISKAGLDTCLTTQSTSSSSLTKETLCFWHRRWNDCFILVSLVHLFYLSI